MVEKLTFVDIIDDLEQKHDKIPSPCMANRWIKNQHITTIDEALNEMYETTNNNDQQSENEEMLNDLNDSTDFKMVMSNSINSSSMNNTEQ